jgi:hypothetical protein
LHVLLEQLVGEGLRDVAFVAEQLAKETFGQPGNRRSSTYPASGRKPTTRRNR